MLRGHAPAVGGPAAQSSVESLEKECKQLKKTQEQLEQENRDLKRSVYELSYK
jgi:cell division protein FtsB